MALMSASIQTIMTVAAAATTACRGGSVCAVSTAVTAIRLTAAPGRRNVRMCVRRVVAMLTVGRCRIR